MPRERVLCVADNEQDALVQLAAVMACGSQLLWPEDALHRDLAKQLPQAIVSARIHFAKADALMTQAFDAVIYHGDSDQLRDAVRAGRRTRRRNCLGAGLRARGNQHPAGTPVGGAFAQRQHRGRRR